MKVPGTLQKLISEIKTVEFDGHQVIPNFGIFIDTHRDQPHIGSFHEDIHRGQCRPTSVHLRVDDATVDPARVYLIEPTLGSVMDYHVKHLFVTPDYFQDFMIAFVTEHGKTPLDADGIMVTSHLRDPRAKVYKLKSFRQMLEWRHEAEKADHPAIKIAA